MTLTEVVFYDAPVLLDAILYALIIFALAAHSWSLYLGDRTVGRVLVLCGWSWMAGRFGWGFLLSGELQISASGMPALLLLAGGTVASAIEQAFDVPSSIRSLLSKKP